MTPRLVLACLVGFALAPLDAGAAIPPGEFILEAGQANPQIGDWGDACGVQPGVSRGTKGARYKWTADGVLPGKGESTPLFAAGVCRLATGQPNLIETRSASVIRCKSPAGDPRQVVGRVEVIEQDADTLRVNQRFAFNWTLDGTACAVTLRGSYRLRRNEPSEPEVAAVPAPACASPGALARLEKSGPPPSVEAGQSIRLRVRGVDAADCPVPLPPLKWSADAGAVRNGVFTASNAVAGDTIAVTASSDRQVLRFDVRVVAPIDLAPALPTATATEPPAAPPASRDGFVATSELRAPPPPRGSRLLVGLFVGFGIAVVALGLWISWRTVQLRRGDVLRKALEEEADADTIRTTALPAPAQSAPPVGVPRQCPECDRVFASITKYCPHDGRPLEVYRPAPGTRDVPEPARQCPKCDAIHPANATFCPHDGSRLPAAKTPIKAMICPDCGAHFPDGTVFCGVDGARLVLLN